MKKNNLLFLLSLCTIILFTQCEKDPEKCSTDDTESVKGCTDSAAINFDANAECDDGSCVLKCSAEDTESVKGCMDSAATNYNANAECEDDSCEYELSQEALNGATGLASSLTGPQHGMDFAHNGTMDPATTTIRDIFTNDGSVPASDAISPGFVITKHTFAADSLGAKGDLLVTFAMVKREAGFWEEANDWEYFSFPNNDPEVDFTANPNGVLANAGVSGVGHTNCWGCHNAAQGNDQLFSND